VNKLAKNGPKGLSYLQLIIAPDKLEDARRKLREDISLLEDEFNKLRVEFKRMKLEIIESLNNVFAELSMLHLENEKLADTKRP